jgi:hypothetical protein
MFFGFFGLTETAWGLVSVEDAMFEPAPADSLPTFRVYGVDSQTPKATGTTTAWDIANVTGVYKVAFSVSGAFERGLSYSIVVTWAIGGDNRQTTRTFSVN